VLVLEGGYNLTSISNSFAECVRVLKSPTQAVRADAFARASLGDASAVAAGIGYLPAPYRGPLLPSKAAERAVRAAVRRQSPFWRLRKACASPVMSGAAAVPYATRPVVVRRSTALGGGWALRFTAPRFLGRLGRFARHAAPGAAWVKVETAFLQGADDESIDSDNTGSSDGEEVDEEAAYWASVGGGGNDDDGAFDESDSEDGEGESDDSSGESECGPKGDFAFNFKMMRGEGGDEDEEDEKDEEDDEENAEDEESWDSSGSERAWSLPEGVELVAAEDDFTPFEAKAADPKPKAKLKAKPKAKKRAKGGAKSPASVAKTAGKAAGARGGGSKVGDGGGGASKAPKKKAKIGH